MATVEVSARPQSSGCCLVPFGVEMMRTLVLRESGCGIGGKGLGLGRTRVVEFKEGMFGCAGTVN
jgi:hypothetical protein